MEAERVVLRSIKGGDVDTLEKWNDDDGLNSLMGGKLPFDVAFEMVSHGKISNKWNSKVFAITTKTGHLIGDIYFVHITWRNRNAELIVRIGEEQYWNKGYGTEAVCHMLYYGFYEMELKRIYLRVYVKNKRAIKCYEKCGFKKEGIARIDHDSEKDKKDYGNILLMSIVKDEFALICSEKSPRRKIIV